MSLGGALRAALLDLYHQSWRLLLLNSALAGAVLALALAASYAQPALLLLPAVGPLAAALMHCAVTLAQTEELRLVDAAIGLRLHWRRGLVLALLAAVVVALGLFALVFYARAGGFALPLAVLVVYVLVVFALLQLALWPLAVAERERALRAVLGEAALLLLRRPLPSLGLASVLLLVNAVGAVAILPLLTLTIAYSFLAAAHFTLPPKAQFVLDERPVARTRHAAREGPASTGPSSLSQRR